MITFLGDVALIDEELVSDYKPKHPYIFNLEYVIGNKEELVPVPNKINLCAPRYDFVKLFGKNPLAVNVVNNHIYDYGIKGYDDTIKKMKSEGISVITDTPLYLSENLCVFSYMLLANNEHFSFDYEKTKRRIERIKCKNGDARIVIQMHWGIENHPQENEQQRMVAHWLIDNGADLVIGHHPHCMQSVEEYKGKMIFYSLGNALFGNISQPSHFDSDNNARRIYRFKWQKWNRKSISVTYDEKNNNVEYIEELYQKNNRLVCVKRNICKNYYVKKRNKKIYEIIYRVRKYFLFFVSNVMVNGCIFDFDAIQHEMRKK